MIYLAYPTCSAAVITLSCKVHETKSILLIFMSVGIKTILKIFWICKRVSLSRCWQSSNQNPSPQRMLPLQNIFPYARCFCSSLPCSQHFIYCFRHFFYPAIPSILLSVIKPICKINDVHQLFSVKTCKHSTISSFEFSWVSVTIFFAAGNCVQDPPSAVGNYKLNPLPAFAYKQGKRKPLNFLEAR